MSVKTTVLDIRGNVVNRAPQKGDVIMTENDQFVRFYNMGDSIAKIDPAKTIVKNTQGR